MSDGYTKGQQLNEQKHASASGIKTPVQRFLRHKLSNIVKFEGDLEEKKANLALLLSDLHEEQEENTPEQSTSSCGQ